MGSEKEPQDHFKLIFVEEKTLNLKFPWGDFAKILLQFLVNSSGLSHNYYSIWKYYHASQLNF